MKVSLTINGLETQADIEPRTSLADFIREHQMLTGTHIGCEHGVCGACTVLVDDAPARSCITHAVACDGAEITTIEGLEDDPVAIDLRRAFSDHHALQCGYCTPGMLISARDVVTRLGDADEKRIRLELSGNLCRCTGYVGIVAAVRSVLADRGGADPSPAGLRERLGPVGAHPPRALRVSPATPRRRVAAEATGQPVSRPTSRLGAEDWAAVEAQGVELRQSFRVSRPRPDTWRFFGDLDQVAQCIPGAHLTAPPRGAEAEGEVQVTLGPIVSRFAVVVEIERDDAAFRGRVRGAGRDLKSASSGRAIIAYQLEALEETETRVDVSMKLQLAGPLAQFNRSGLLRDVADHFTEVFARNLEARLSGAPVAQDDRRALSAGVLLRAALWRRLKAFFRRVLRG